jgi:hypothetical protein
VEASKWHRGHAPGLLPVALGGPCERVRTDAELLEAICEIRTELDGQLGRAGSYPNSSQRQI